MDGADFLSILRECPSYVINLDRNVCDRLPAFEAQDLSCAFSRVPERYRAVDGNALSPDFVDKKLSVRAKLSMARRRREHSDLGSLGALGASLSHIGLWQYFWEMRTEPFMVVFEDDADLTNFEKILQIGEDATVPPFDIFLLGSSKSKCARLSGKYNRVKQFTGMHAYVISREGARRALEYALPVEFHIDWYVSYLSQLDTLIVISRSDIHWGQVGESSLWGLSKMRTSVIGHSIPEYEIWRSLAIAATLIGILLLIQHIKTSKL
jgi:GR25 family glycosyltransferase involved in LPS biosynthesis